MKNHLSILPLALCAFLAAAFPPPAWAQTAAQQTLEGNLNGAPYVIKIPYRWNGTLLMFEDGYRDVADAPGETEDRVAQAAYPGMEELLLSRGYALAGSAFRVNGYNIEEGIEDTIALMQFFKHTVGKPRRSIQLGLSGGATRAARIAELRPGLFDGAIATCGVMAGTPLFFDRAVAFAVAYQAAFGWPAAWGTPGDLRDDLDFENDVLPVFLPQLSDPGNFGLLEFMRLVNGLPAAGFYDGDSPALFINMFFTTEARAQMERKFGAPGAQNRDHHYRLSGADKAYLAQFGVDADTLLARMNAHDVYPADKSVRRLVAKFGSFTGEIETPLLSMHAISDGLATVDNESVYKAINRAAGRKDLLLQVYTNGVGHCTFTSDQVLSTIRAMEHWLDTGHKPHSSFFPAGQDFNHDFHPDPWPQPVHVGKPHHRGDR